MLSMCLCMFILNVLLLKLIIGDGNSYFRWVPYIPGTTAQMPGAEPGPTAR